MAIDQSVYGQVQQTNPLNALAKGYELGNTIRQQPMVDKMNQQKLQAGQMELENAKLKQQEAIFGLAKGSLQADYYGAVQIAPYLASGDMDSITKIINQRKQAKQLINMPTDTEDNFLAELQSNPEQAKKSVANMMAIGQQLFGKSQASRSVALGPGGQLYAPDGTLLAENNNAKAGGHQMQVPFSIQEYEYMRGLSPDQQEQFFNVKRAPQYFNMGDVRMRANQLDTDANPVAPLDMGATQQDIQQTLSTQKASKEREVTKQKEVGKQEGEKFVQGTMNAPTALKLMADMDNALQDQPESAFGRGMQSGLGFFGYGDQRQQAGMSVADTAGAQLMAYAEKLPGPASDADRQDFKASVGILASSVATREQKRAALAQAKKSFERLVQKYGSQGQSQQGGFPTTDPLSKSYDYEYDPATGSFK